MSFAEFIARTAPLSRPQKVVKKRRRRREGELRRGDRVYFELQPVDYGTVWQVFSDGSVGVHWDVFAREPRNPPYYHRGPASSLVLES